MSSKRPIVLMGILMALLVYVGLQWFPMFVPTPPPAKATPLPGKNAISKLELQRAPDGRWVVTIDYYYTGEPWAALRVEQVNSREGLNQSPVTALVASSALERGAHRLSLDLHRPGDETFRITREVKVVMLAAQDKTVLASQQLSQTIQWPTFQAMAVERELGTRTPDQVLAHAVELIDANRSDTFDQARLLLESLVQRDPRNDGAFVELARVAMKTNWGPEGLSQAEALIGSALQLRPESANAKILLGYVYANQKRYKEAEQQFIAVSMVETPNLWLGTNWGEMLEQQGKKDAAIAKFREVLTHPPKQDTYDRARRYAAIHLLDLLSKSKDVDGLERIHKQLIADYGPVNCFGVAYAKFLLQQRGDADAAMAMARRAADSRCDTEAAHQVLGLAHYFAWSQAKEPERAEALRQARVARPVGAVLFYELAMNERTMPAAQLLIAAGERVDQPDNSQATALVYALRANDLAAARRLLRLGARPDAPVGAEQMPVALLPVLTGDLEGIRLMQRSGINYSKLRYQGMTAIDHARRIGDNRLLQALDPKTGVL